MRRIRGRLGRPKATELPGLKNASPCARQLSCLDARRLCRRQSLDPSFPGTRWRYGDGLMSIQGHSDASGPQAWRK